MVEIVKFGEEMTNTEDDEDVKVDEVMCRGYWRCQRENERRLGAGPVKPEYSTEIVHPHMVRPAWIEEKKR